MSRHTKQVFNEIMKRRKKLVYDALEAINEQGVDCYTSSPILQKKTSLSEMQVKTVVNELTGSGCVLKNSGGKLRVNYGGDLIRKFLSGKFGHRARVAK